MDDILLDIGGKEFYFDIDAMSEAIRFDENVIKQTKEEINNAADNIIPTTIDVTKFEMYRDLMGTLLNCNEIIDDKMGIMALNSLPIPFKLSFNTLLMKGIIKEL